MITGQEQKSFCSAVKFTTYHHTKIGNEMDKLTENLIHYVRTFRHESNLTQREFGEKVGLNHYKVENLEQGKMTGLFKNFDLLRELAKLRGLSLVTLIDILEGNKDEKGEHDSFTEEVLDLLYKLPVEQQIKVRDFLSISNECPADDVFQFISSKEKTSLLPQLNKLSTLALRQLSAFLKTVTEDSKNDN